MADPFKVEPAPGETMAQAIIRRISELSAEMILMNAEIGELRKRLLALPQHDLQQQEKQSG